MYSLLYLLMLISSGTAMVVLRSTLRLPVVTWVLLISYCSMEEDPLLLINMATHPYTGLLIMVRSAHWTSISDCSLPPSLPLSQVTRSVWISY